MNQYIVTVSNAKEVACNISESAFVKYEGTYSQTLFKLVMNRIHGSHWKAVKQADDFYLIKVEGLES